MTTVFLDQILEATRQRIKEKRGQRAALERAAREAPPARDFMAALRRPTLGLIAEIKRASPSRGPLRPNLDAASLARTYAGSGAAALSVLTEPRFFLGGWDDLKAARQATSLPVLCKDFIVDPLQVYEARAQGSDAVLLIAAILAQPELESLLGLARSLGMACLVEVHREDEVARVVKAGAGLMGVNNRNLVDFSVDLETSFRLRPLIPSGRVAVSESGIHTAKDVARLREVGFQAILLGEALVTSPDPGAKIRELLGI